MNVPIAMKLFEGNKILTDDLEYIVPMAILHEFQFKNKVFSNLKSIKIDEAHL